MELEGWKFRVGDAVYIRHSGFSGYVYYGVYRIKSISNKRGDIRLEGREEVYDWRGWKKDRERWSQGAELVLATKELADQIKEQTARAESISLLRDFKWSQLSTPTLAKIAKLVQPRKSGEEPKT